MLVEADTSLWSSREERLPSTFYVSVMLSLTTLDTAYGLIVAVGTGCPTWRNSPGYTWSQTQSTVTLVFEVPATVTVMDIMVTFQSDQLIAGVEVGRRFLFSGFLVPFVPSVLPFVISSSFAGALARRLRFGFSSAAQTLF